MQHPGDLYSDASLKDAANPDIDKAVLSTDLDRVSRYSLTQRVSFVYAVNFRTESLRTFIINLAQLNYLTVVECLYFYEIERTGRLIRSPSSTSM